MARLRPNCDINELIPVKWYTRMAVPLLQANNEGVMLSIMYVAGIVYLGVLMAGILFSLSFLPLLLIPAIIIIMGSVLLLSCSQGSEGIEHRFECSRETNLRKLEHEIGETITVQYLQDKVMQIIELGQNQCEAFIQAVEQGITKPGYFARKTSNRLRDQLFDKQLTAIEKQEAILDYLTFFNGQHTGKRLFCDLLRVIHQFLPVKQAESCPKQVDLSLPKSSQLWGKPLFYKSQEYSENTQQFLQGQDSVLEERESWWYTPGLFLG